jgi:cardiolipin synthase
VERGAEVTIVVPGAKSDHLLTRRSSRALYGDLLRGGARIFEYEPSMAHAKIALFDGKWALAGSTNLDSRSFGINDEVNVAMPDPALVARLEEDFQRDLARSREMTYEQWKARPFWERMQEWAGWVLQKQQ